MAKEYREYPLGERSEKVPADAPHPISRADETASRWAAARNYLDRCAINLQEATAHHEKAVADERSAWEQLEVASGRAPETGQAPEAPFDRQIRSGSIGQGAQIGRAY